MASQEGQRGVISESARALDQAAGEILKPDEQLDLLPSRFSGERLEAQRVLLREDHRARGRGRPKGARNRVTADTIEFMRKLGFDPAMFAARWSLHTPETLAKELGCSVLEAWDRLKALNDAWRPVFYANAVPTDDDGKPLPMFQMVFNGHAQGPENNDPPWLYLKKKSEQAQDVTPGAPDKSQTNSLKGDDNAD